MIEPFLTVVCTLFVIAYVRIKLDGLQGVLSRVNRQLAEIHDWTEGWHYWNTEQKAQDVIQDMAEAEVATVFPDSNDAKGGAA